MAGDPGQRELRIPVVVTGEVESVNRYDHTLNIRRSSDGTLIEGVRILSQGSCSAETGAGSHGLPMPGELCYMINTSDGKDIVIGYSMPKCTGEGRKGGMPDMQEGDHVLVGNKGNGVFVRRGGVVQIISKALAQTLYIPTGNIIRHIFENMEMLSPLGELRWSHEAEEGPEGTGASYVLKVNAHAGDSEPAMTMRVGALPSATHIPDAPFEGEITFEFTVNGSEFLYGLRVDTSGNVSAGIKKDAFFDIKGAALVKIKSDLDLEVTGAINMTATNKLSIQSKLGNIEVKSAVKDLIVDTIKSEIKSKLVNLGIGASQPAVKGYTMASMLVRTAGMLAMINPIEALSLLNDANDILASKVKLA